MYKGKKIVGLIPARGNSKGLPGKNIKILNGKPLIVWSIDAGRRSKYLDELVVSTDSPKIRRIAERFGAKAPFLRPKALAGDKSPTFAVIRHAVEFLRKKMNKNFDYIVLIEPTSPLRDVADIDRAIELLVEKKRAQAIVSVCRTEGTNPAFLVLKDKKGFMRGYANKKMTVLRRQDIEDVYFLEGTIYASRTDVFLRRKTFYHEKTLTYEVPKWKSPEVDDIYDFLQIEAIMKYRRYKK